MLKENKISFYIEINERIDAFSSEYFFEVSINIELPEEFYRYVNSYKIIKKMWEEIVKKMKKN